jgi:REP element-mobilizing transposase RayT
MNATQAEQKRSSIRLKGYDYSRTGAYFVTICVQNHECLFGEIVQVPDASSVMQLNDAGRMVEIVWQEIPRYYPHINIDEFQIMPNHIHGIIAIEIGQPQGVAPTASTLSLADVVHRFKTLTTKRYVDGVNQADWKRFDKRLWQRNYYERIIRDEAECNRIREYIINNPCQWEFDRNHADFDALW